jgi:hypothetical protein
LARSRRRDHLRLVEPAEPNLPAVIAAPLGRKEVQQLTQQLVDVLIEMMDIVDGDADLEPNGDELDDGEGI